SRRRHTRSKRDWSSDVCSSDLEFMSSVTGVIFHLEFSRLSRYTATYEKFIELAELAKKQHLDAYERQADMIKKTETFIAKNKAQIGRASCRERKQSTARTDATE